jgi:regulator of sigma E protease
VAVACGVKVLRFSVGFGKTLYRWKPRQAQRPGQDTEFVIGAFPLGGYVKMLDEREGPSRRGAPPGLQHPAAAQARRHRRRRPGANLLLAVLLYATVNWMGCARAAPGAGQPGRRLGRRRGRLRGGERVERAGFDRRGAGPVRSFEELRWLLTRGALDGRDLRWKLVDDGRRRQREVLLPLSRLEQPRCRRAAVAQASASGRRWTPPVLGDVMAGGAAERAGLRKGDLVLRVPALDVVDGQQLRE